jgi:hypothetical protein
VRSIDQFTRHCAFAGRENIFPLANTFSTGTFWSKVGFKVMGNRPNKDKLRKKLGQRWEG